jgi:cell pole-organizing protein PopZ
VAALNPEGAAMTDPTRPADPAMADILASIRRIVADESAAAGGEGVLLLTPAMRIDGPTADLEAASPGLDEAVVADVARAVLHDELQGDFGRTLSERIRAIVREEVRQALGQRPH